MDGIVSNYNNNLMLVTDHNGRERKVTWKEFRRAIRKSSVPKYISGTIEEGDKVGILGHMLSTLKIGRWHYGRFNKAIRLIDYEGPGSDLILPYPTIYLVPEVDNIEDPGEEHDILVLDNNSPIADLLGLKKLEDGGNVE